MSSTHITDLVTFLGLSLRSLRQQGAASQKRNTLICLLQTMQRRFLSELERPGKPHLAISFSDEEAVALKALLKEIKPLLEQMPPSLEKERRLRSLRELQQVFAYL